MHGDAGACLLHFSLNFLPVPFGETIKTSAIHTFTADRTHVCYRTVKRGLIASRQRCENRKSLPNERKMGAAKLKFVEGIK